MILNYLLFWQPKVDYLQVVLSTPLGRRLLIVFNYLIWTFLFYVSYLLVKSNTNIFWQLLFATLLGEVVERFVKSKVYWKRPMFVRHNSTPPGLVSNWYKTGSFPSGHTIKSVYFLLFVIQYQVISPTVFILVTAPLLIFRVIVGFHFPVDLIGGGIIGILLWLFTSWIEAPDIANQLVKTIFNFFFFIK